MRKHFKIGYRRAIGLTLILVAFSLLSSLIAVFFHLGQGLPQSILLPLMYVSPFVLFFLFISHKIRRENVTLDLLSRRSSWEIYLLMLPLIACVMIIVHYISSSIPENGPILGRMYQEIERILEEQLRHPLSLVASTVLLAPLCEEIFFRGILLNGLLHNKVHPMKAILFSSLLFGLIHMNPWQFVGGFIIGGLLGLVYFCTRSILNCILLHAFNNSLAVLTLLLWTKDGEDDPISIFLEANPWLFFIALALILIGGYTLLQQTEKTWKSWSSPLITHTK